MSIADITVSTVDEAHSFCRRLLATLDARKCDLRVVLSIQRSTRSSLQNRALWGVAYKIVEESTGYRPYEFHDLMCRKHFGEVVVDIQGVKFSRAARTTTRDEDGKEEVINTLAFMEFYAFVQEWAALKLSGLVIPDPDPKLRKWAMEDLAA